MLENLIDQSAAILNSNFIAIVILKDKHIVWANAAMHRIYGYQPNNLIGQPTRNLFLNQDAYETFGHETGQAIADNRAYADTILQKRKDGTTGWYEFNISSLGGDPELTVCAVVDRTADYQNHMQMKDNELRYRSVVEDQTEVICRFLPDGTFVFVNEIYCRMFGKTEEELIGQRWHPAAHPDDIPMIEAGLREMLPDNPVITIENRVYVADGGLRWMQFVNRGFFADDGSLKEIQTVGRDITRLKEIELNLRESEQKLQRAQSVGKIGSFAMGSREEIFIITQETARLFDLEDTGLTTFTEWFSRVHPDDQDKVESAWRAALLGAPYDMTYRIVVKTRYAGSGLWRNFNLMIRGIWLKLSARCRIFPITSTSI